MLSLCCCCCYTNMARRKKHPSMAKMFGKLSLSSTRPSTTIAKRHKKRRGCLVKKFAGFLRYLKSVTPRQQRQLLNRASGPQLSAICEICDNVLRGRARISPQQLRQLHPHKGRIRMLANRRVPLYKKRGVLQKGGLPLIPILLAIAGPIIDQIVRQVTS